MKHIPAPEGNLIQWAIHNPAAVSRAIELLNKLQAMKVRIVSPSGPQVAGTSVLESDSDITILVPVKFAATISPPSGGSTVDTECRAALVLLLTALSQTGINP